MKKISLILLLLFFTSCQNQNFSKQVKINEASGICFMQNSSNFFVVGDEGEITELDENLKKLRQYKYDKNYDFESIICEKNNLLTIDEKTWEIYKIDVNSFKILEKYKIEWYKLNKKWIEGFTKIWKNKYVISTQTKKNNLLILEKTNSTGAFNPLKFKVIEKINFPYSDLSWLNYYKNFLYIISDKNDKIFKYDLIKKQIIQKIKLPKSHWEWISRNNSWELYLSDDSGRVVKL